MVETNKPIGITPARPVEVSAESARVRPELPRDEPLLEWLSSDAAEAIEQARSVLIVGSGLGTETLELSRRGVDVFGCDPSRAAVDIARRSHPKLAFRFVHADIMDPPSALCSRFELVIGRSLLQSHAPGHWPDLVRSLIGLASQHGAVAVIERVRSDASHPCSSPPYAISLVELTDLFEAFGWRASMQASILPAAGPGGGMRIAQFFARN
jgi:SAM-dependent methyltransferase